MVDIFPEMVYNAHILRTAEMGSSRRYADAERGSGWCKLP